MVASSMSALLACSVVLLPALRVLPSGTATRQHPPHISMVAQFRPEALTRDAPFSSSTITKDKPHRAATTPSKAPPPSTTSPATTSLSRGPTKGVPVKAPPVAVDPLLTGEDLVRSPNVFRGFSPSGEQLERLPLLTRDEELTLVRAAWFFTAAADARRDLEADASVGRPAPNHVDIVAAVHHLRGQHRELLVPWGPHPVFGPCQNRTVPYCAFDELFEPIAQLNVTIKPFEDERAMRSWVQGARATHDSNSTVASRAQREQEGARGSEREREGARGSERERGAAPHSRPCR